MSNLSEPSREDASPEVSSPTQKTGACSNTLNTIGQQASVYGVAAGYCLSASLLSIINKWAIMKFPYPGALTALQYATSVAGVLLCGQLKLIEHDGLNLRTMWKFLPAAVMFYISIFTNSELLLHANVDTFQIVNSCYMPMWILSLCSALLCPYSSPLERHCIFTSHGHHSGRGFHFPLYLVEV